MENFKEFLNEVFEFDRNSLELHPDTNLIDYHSGEERFYLGKRLKTIPFKEMIFHTPVPDLPKDKRNLWVHVMRYPSGYGNINGPHLQVHFDINHVSDHQYLDSKRHLDDVHKSGDSLEKPEPGYILSHAFNAKTGLDPLTHGGGNAFSGLNRAKGTGLSTIFRKIAPHIVKIAWHASKLHPTLPVAFSAGSDVPGHAERKFLMYDKITHALRDANLIEPESKYVMNNFKFQGQIPYFKVIKPIHR